MHFIPVPMGPGKAPLMIPMRHGDGEPAQLTPGAETVAMVIFFGLCAVIVAVMASVVWDMARNRKGRL